MVKKLLGLLLCGGIGASIWILPKLSEQPLWMVAIPLAVAILLGGPWSASSPLEGERRSSLSTIGLVLAFALGLAYRFSYLDTVPSGADMAETPLFTSLSARFLTEGFWYTPYVGYMHTLYAYIGALGMLLSSDWEWGFRAATAVVSFLTLITSFFAIRALSAVGSKAAWIGIGLMATSPWHIWISRFLMQKFLLPFCESITLFGLIVAATGIKRSHRYLGAVVAAIGFILGLHAYWGCYVLGGTWAVFLVYLVAFHRDQARRYLGPLFTASFLATCLALPVLYVLIPELGASGYIKSKLDYGDNVFLHKVVRNLEFLLWALSSSTSKYGTSFVTAPVAFLFLVGLFGAVRRFRSSIPSALLVINFTLFFVGIMVTWAHDMYMTGLLFSVYCLAGQGLVRSGQTLIAAFGGGRALFLGLAPIALLGEQAVTNYMVSLVRPTYTFFSPYANPATHLRDEMRALTSTHSVWIPRREFGESLWTLCDQGFPEYAFVRKLHVFNPDVPWFEPSAVQGTQGAELYLIPSEGSQRLIDTTLRKLYPNLVVHSLPVPPPHDQHPENLAPRALRVSIPVSDVFSLKEAPATPVGNEIESRGFLGVAQDVVYSFCSEDNVRPQLIVDDRTIEVMSCSDQSAKKHFAFLGAGLHPVRIVAQHKSAELKLFAKTKDGAASPIRELLWGFSPPDANAWAHQNRGDSGKPASFVYEARESFPQRDLDPLRSISARNGNETILSFMKGIFSFDRASNTTKQILDFQIGDFVKLGRAGTPLLMLRSGAKIFSLVGTTEKQLHDFGCPVTDFDQQGDKVATLCADGRIFITKGEKVETTTWVVKDQAVTGLVWIGDTLYVGTTVGTYYRNIITGTTGKIVGALMFNMGMSADDRGNIYIWSSDRNWTPKVYSSSGERLFDPTTGSTEFFFDEKGAPLKGVIMPKFFADGFLGAYGNDLRIFQKRAVN